MRSSNFSWQIEDLHGAIAGAVTSPPIGVSNSHSHTSALLNVVGSPLGSHVDGVSDKNDLKKSNHLSSSELDIPSFSTKGPLNHGCLLYMIITRHK